MRTITARKFALISAVLLLFGSVAVAVVVKQTVRYGHAVRAIKGRVAAVGHVIPVTVWVDVYDNVQVCLDDSMPVAEQRKKQAKVASVEPTNNGEFSIKHLPKGFYEVEVGNHNGGGYHVLSVLVNIDPKGANDKLCVDLSLEGGDPKSTVAKCSEVAVEKSLLRSESWANQKTSRVPRIPRYETAAVRYLRVLLVLANICAA